jgi:HPt (histidine-containing phosphotransfer) domain-containing protein
MSSSLPPDLDPDAIANLRALGDDGDDAFLKEIIAIYLEDTPLRLADLRAAAASGDRALYSRAAHTIKGSSSNVGAHVVRGLAEKLEHRSKSEPHADLESLRLELEAAFERAAEALRMLRA